MSDVGVRPIETTYKGYRFRSRLEARWAVVFDAIGIAWEYEKEGFELPSGRYLPDFWIPYRMDDRDTDEGAWVEIKPTRPNERETRLLRELHQSTRFAAYALYGSVGFGTFVCEIAGAGSFGPCSIGRRGALFPLYIGRSERTEQGERALRVALAAGMSARFEHDERWRP